MSVVSELPDPGGTSELLTPTGKRTFNEMSPTDFSPKDNRSKRINNSDLSGNVSSLNARDNCGEYNYCELVSQATEYLAKINELVNDQGSRMNVGVVLRVANERQLKKLESVDAIKSVGLRLEKPKGRRPRIIVKDVPGSMEDRAFLTALYRQNIKDELKLSENDFIKSTKIVRHRKLENGRQWIGLELEAAVRKHLANPKDKLYIDWATCRLIDDIEVVRCLNCQQFGHVQKFCIIKTPTCANCAAAHETRACPDKDTPDFKPTCAQCQLNLHNDKIATSELDRLILEQKLDIVLLQEQYQSAHLRRNVVQLDCRSQAGIYVASSNFTVTSLRNLMTSHCAVAEISSSTCKVYVVSCYFQNSHPIDPHLHHLRYVLQFLVGHKTIIGADVNASSSLWYGKLRSTDTVRRCAVEDFIAEMNLIIHNTPDAPPTFCNPMGESSIDVTLTRGDVSISGWRVLPDAFCSDHRLIVYGFIPRVAQDPKRAFYNFRYKTKGANWALFGSLFATHTKDFSRSSLSAEESAEILSETFTYCADVTIGRGSITNTRRCDWWNDRLAELRRSYRKARRKLNTIKKHNVTGDLYNNALIALRVARSHYRAAVEKSKGILIQKLVDKLDREGPWSPLYHEFKANRSIDLAYIQNIKINNRYITGVEQTAEYLLDSLVPDDRPENDTDHHRQIRQWASGPPLSPMSDLPSSDEFLGIIKSLPLNKASGDDKISNKMIKEACKLSGDTIFTVFKRCIAEGIFPRIWRCGTTKLRLGHHSVSKALTMGCPQGSVLGPYLWNIGFDDFLAIPIPSGCTLNVYADDGLLLVESDTRAGLERLANRCLNLISQWGERNRLTFAPNKTFQLLLKGNLKSPPSIRFDNVTVKN
ncbi:unnamed protein product [Arctia plantaginis]|uniref:Reverse transcriptase domain-containing protein n=1 Tax=Arctia plantaginis TaxID=874455 RepID=A0A8S1B3H6_ARCPL|nr:unnamed protein product [Arctia plantaginis]